MYIETVPNRNSPPAILLREGYREGGKVVKRTLANLSHWDPQLVEHLRILLKGGVAVAEALMSIERALPHGHVAAVLGMHGAAASTSCWIRRPRRCLAGARPGGAALLEPASKLATSRSLQPSLRPFAVAGAGARRVRGRPALRALDWLGEAQPRIEPRLARRHLADGMLVLYDVTSTWVTGRHCALARFGYSRDGKSANCRSCSACCVPPMAVRWRSRCSTATPPTR